MSSQDSDSEMEIDMNDTGTSSNSAQEDNEQARLEAIKDHESQKSHLLS
jgi:hypothetical protein